MRIVGIEFRLDELAYLAQVETETVRESLLSRAEKQMTAGAVQAAGWRGFPLGMTDAIVVLGE
jgi:hypothetical protein